VSLTARFLEPATSPLLLKSRAKKKTRISRDSLSSDIIRMRQNLLITYYSVAMVDSLLYRTCCNFKRFSTSYVTLILKHYTVESLEYAMSRYLGIYSDSLSSGIVHSTSSIISHIQRYMAVTLFVYFVLPRVGR
jgi:hypothetical protein